jgi:hypothetical protein
MSTVAIVLIAWAGALAILVGALALATRHRRSAHTEDVKRRGTTIDRRRGEGDRRVGLPDLREEKVERRSASGDRRHGAPDRRRVLGPA